MPLAVGVRRSAGWDGLQEPRCHEHHTIVGAASSRDPRRKTLPDIDDDRNRLRYLIEKQRRAGLAFCG